MVTGFTSGIAVVIFSSQVKDLLGLDLAAVPAEFPAKWAAYWAARDSLNPAALALACGLDSRPFCACATVATAA